MIWLKEIIRHNGFRRYFTNASWLFIENVLRIIAGLFVGVYVARYLGPDKFGIFSYSLAIVALFGIISKLGLDSITVRELVNYSNRRDTYLGTVFWLKVSGAILTLGIIGIAVRFISNDSTTNLYIFIIASGLLFQSFEVVDFYFQSKVLAKYVSICKLAQLMLSSVLKLYFIFIRADLFWFVLTSLIDQVSLAISYVFAYQSQRIGAFFNHFQIRIAKGLLKDSWPLFFSGIAIMVYMRIDQVMIKAMLGAREVGLYSAAVRLSESWYFVPAIIANSLFPAILNAKKNSEIFYYERLQRLYDLMALMALIVALLMTFLSTPVVTLLYGQAFRGAAGVLAVHVWAGVFVALGSVRGKWLLSENLQIISAENMATGAVINVILNYILIPRYGIMGAAIATVISYGFAVYVSLLFYKNARKTFYLLSRALNPIRLLSVIRK